VIIDLFNRYVVGWMVAAKECKHLAAQLFAESIARHGVDPGLTVHSDRGAAMKSDTLAQLLATLGVGQSFSRPHVSDDNAFSEAQFKTLKYQPDYPSRSQRTCAGSPTALPQKCISICSKTSWSVSLWTSTPAALRPATARSSRTDRNCSPSIIESP
jgi:transposase InsO family protein